MILSRKKTYFNPVSQKFTLTLPHLYVIYRPEDILNAEAIIFPGVGSFGQTMKVIIRDKNLNRFDGTYRVCCICPIEPQGEELDRALEDIYCSGQTVFWYLPRNAVLISGKRRVSRCAGSRNNTRDRH
jgi:hypothetical protein